MIVAVGIGKAASVDHDTVVQKGTVAVGRTLHLAYEIRELLHVVAVDLGAFFDKVRLVAVRHWVSLWWIPIFAITCES